MYLVSLLRTLTLQEFMKSNTEIFAAYTDKKFGVLRLSDKLPLLLLETQSVARY